MKDFPHFNITEEEGMNALSNNIPQIFKRWKRRNKIKRAVLFIALFAGIMVVVFTLKPKDENLATMYFFGLSVISISLALLKWWEL